MPSLQFYLFQPLMWAMRWRQAFFPIYNLDAVVRFRQLSDYMADLTTWLPCDVRVEQAQLGGVPGDWLHPSGAPADPVIVFLHGGSIVFTWGSPHRRMLAYLARFAGLSAFGVDYRLAPDHCYPAAHDDCFTVYKTLVEQGRQVILVGESSGGVLALATLLRAKAAGLPQPPLCLLISPTVDWGFKDERIWHYHDAFIHPRFCTEMHRHYIADHDTNLPDLSPIYADLRGLAPLYIMAGGRELLRGEAQRLAEAAQQQSVPVELHLWPHVWHGWHLLAPQLPEATQALQALGQIIRQRLRHPTPG
jgi:monoterpene epsilon-lactone hydrolase